MPSRFVAAGPILLLGLMWIGPVPPVACGEKGDQPNVVIVMTDDQGYGDLACHGNPVLQTPRLDELHSQSVRMTNYHVFPTCSPTRAALLTGRTANRTGVWHTIAGRSMLRSSEVTMPEYFRPAGYATGCFGKWHLGDNFPMRAIDRSFDDVLVHGGGGIGQTPDHWNNAYFDCTYRQNGHATQIDGFCTDVFFDAALDFIGNQARDGRPFLAYIAPNAAHAPMHAPPQYSKPYVDAGLDTKVANFFGMIANIDHNVGRLVDRLDELGQTDNTILIFTTDNGTAAGGKVFNASMRGFKGSPYEGGHRVPMFIHHPAGNLGPPRDIATLASVTDVLPTLLDWTGIQKLSDAPEIDGVSWANWFGGDSPVETGRAFVVDSQRVLDPQPWRATVVCRDRWRLVDNRELYDVDADPSQKQNVIADHPEVATSLREFYEQWWSDVSTNFDQDARIVVGHPAADPVTLTAHDWFTEKATPWSQQVIRKGQDPTDSKGQWRLEVAEAGRYKIELFRWAPESGLALDAAAPVGTSVPGVEAWRMTPGKALAIRGAEWEFETEMESFAVRAADWDGSPTAARFEVELPAGPCQMRCTFETDDGQRLGAFYAVVSAVR